jgi:CBS-domain-containing membrane protein
MSQRGTRDLKWLHIHVRSTQHDAGSTRITRLVYCPARGAVTSLDDCSNCRHRFAIDRRDRDLFLVCDVEPTLDVPSAELASPQDAGKIQSFARLRDIMSHDVLCVSPDLKIDELLALLLDNSISGAPVVDEQGIALGVITKTDVLRVLQQSRDAETTEALVLKGADGYEYDLGAGFALDRVKQLQVKNVMTQVIFTLPDDAAVERAAAMMSYEGVHRVPVVSENNRVVGLLSSLDILRWVARCAGYVIPDHHLA